MWLVKEKVNSVISISYTNSLPFQNYSKNLSVIINPIDYPNVSTEELKKFKLSLDIQNQNVIFFPGGSALYEKGILVFLSSIDILTKKIIILI